MSPEELFALARLRASIQWPQLAHGIWSLCAPIAVPGLLAECNGAIATDMRWRVYYDPEALASFTVAQAATAIVHEAWHCLRRHGPRVKAAAIEPRWYSARAIALDCEVNGDMERHTPAPDWPYAVPLPSKLRRPMPDGLPWEQYFSAAQDHAGPDTVIRIIGGSSMDGVPRSWERGDLPGVGDVESASIRDTVARAIRAHPGSLPGGWLRWADDVLLPAKVPWQHVLAMQLRGGLATASGAVDFSRAIPSRRQAVTPVVLPVMRRPVVRVDVVADTSGSMGDIELNALRAEVEGIAKATGAGVRGYACDAAVHGGVQHVRSGRGLKLHGGGGTDMGVGIAFAEAQRPKADVLVVITDGFSPWPARRPRFVRTIVVLVGRHDSRDSVPRWALCVEAS